MIMDKEQELTKSESANSPAAMIKMAVEGRADLDKLEKLLTLQEKWEANEARKLFASSFALAQSNIELVLKTKLNPHTRSNYAPLEGIIKMSAPAYTKEGFSVIFYEGETTAPECIRICADVLHTAGHKETYHYDVPLDGVGIKGVANMTKIHAKSSSTSYGRRYLMCMIWNIPTGDNDGQTTTGPIEYISKEQLTQIKDLAVELNVDCAKFLKYMRITKLEEMPKSDFKKAMTAFAARKNKAGQK
jgi:hypothetical protein